MKRNFIKKGIVSLFIVAMIMPLFNGVSFAKDVKKIAGSDRYDTNIKIIDEAVRLGAKTETVIVVSGRDYPDALSAGNIAYRLKLPLILEDNKLEQKIAKYNPTNVIIVGGKNTVVKDSSLEQRLKAKYGLQRLAGTDRYKTSDAVINYIEGLSSIAKYNKVGVRGNDFPDALSAIPLASKSGSLLRLSNNSNNQFYITVGGNVPGKIVSSTLGNQGKNIAGRDRYVTSQKVVNEFNADKLLVVKGNDHPDALAASTLAGVLSANILLVNTNGLTSEDVRLINAANDVIYIGGGVPIYNPVGIEPTEPTTPTNPTEPITPTEPSEPTSTGNINSMSKSQVMDLYNKQGKINTSQDKLTSGVKKSSFGVDIPKENFKVIDYKTIIFKDTQGQMRKLVLPGINPVDGRLYTKTGPIGFQYELFGAEDALNHILTRLPNTSKNYILQGIAYVNDKEVCAELVVSQGSTIYYPHFSLVAWGFAEIDESFEFVPTGMATSADKHKELKTQQGWAKTERYGIWATN